MYELYKNNYYGKALDAGRDMLKTFPNDPALLFYTAESARRLKYYPTAEIYFEQIPDTAKRGSLAEVDFFIGQTKKSLGKYQQAIDYYRRYLLGQENEDEFLVHLAKDEINNCEWITNKLAENEKDLFDVNSMNININSGHSEIAPLRYADKIYFTAIYPDLENKVNVSRIYSAIQDHKARLESFNPTSKDLHAAHISLMPDASKMFYTICTEQKKSSQLRCEIWSRDRKYEGGWGAPVRLSRNINRRSSTMLHPTVGWDMYLKSYVLYFASDRPGGQGGLDIWASIINKDGSYGEPFNAPFNTAKDEVTPFFHMPSQTIFYSSNGIPGAGGFDIFYSTKIGEAQWALPVNIGEPLNTAADEYYYSYHTRSGKGYFASNRECKQNSPTGTDCHTDIFDASIFADLHLTAYDSKTEKRLNLPDITVLDLNQGTVHVIAPELGGEYFRCRLDADKLHHLAIFAEGYKPTKIVLSTKNLPYAEVLKKDVYLFEGDATAEEQVEMEQYFEKAGVGSGNPELEALRAILNSKVVKP